MAYIVLAQAADKLPEELFDDEQEMLHDKHDPQPKVERVAVRVECQRPSCRLLGISFIMTNIAALLSITI